MTPSLFAEMQAIALDDPCFLGGETAKPKYGHRLGSATVVLTVNAGYE